MLPPKTIASRAAHLGLGVVLLSCATLSIDEEKRLGDAARKGVAEHFEFIRDPHVVSFIRELGGRLERAAEPSPFRFEFHVLDDEHINAFAVPAGTIYLHTGVICAAVDPAQLAGVMAHEMAHVTQRHVAELYRRRRNTGLAAAVASILTGIVSKDPTTARAGGVAADLAATAYLGTFTREAEREADRVAIATLIAAGLDPEAMIEFFEIMERQHAGRLHPPPFLSSHPTTPERIAAARIEIANTGDLPPLSRGDVQRLRRAQERLEEVRRLGEPAPG